MSTINFKKFIQIGLMDISTKQVKAKVLYSELDTPFNKYLEVLSKVTRLTYKFLNGTLDKNNEEDIELFNVQAIDELLDTSQLRYLALQNSIESKKVAYENWLQHNQVLLDTSDEKAHNMLIDLKKCRDQLRYKLDRIAKMYKNIEMINKEIESLNDGRTNISITREQWESQLGQTLTDLLIKNNYLRKDTSQKNIGENVNKDKYRTIDDFSIGPQEAKQVNRTLKDDITKLTKELNQYKDQWLKDAEIFTKITDLFQEELKKRQLTISHGNEESDVDMDIDVEDEDEVDSVDINNGELAEVEADDFELYSDGYSDNIDLEEQIEEGDELEELNEVSGSESEHDDAQDRNKEDIDVVKDTSEIQAPQDNINKESDTL